MFGKYRKSIGKCNVGLYVTIVHWFKCFCTWRHITSASWRAISSSIRNRRVRHSKAGLGQRTKLSFFVPKANKRNTNKVDILTCSINIFSIVFYIVGSNKYIENIISEAV